MNSYLGWPLLLGTGPHPVTPQLADWRPGSLSFHQRTET